MAETRKVRTTMRPEEEIEVTEQEYTDLRRQGLLHEPEEKTESRPARRDTGTGGTTK